MREAKIVCKAFFENFVSFRGFLKFFHMALFDAFFETFLGFYGTSLIIFDG
jgi:hypothetical protein